MTLIAEFFDFGLDSPVRIQYRTQIARANAIGHQADRLGEADGRRPSPDFWEPTAVKARQAANET